MLRQLKLDDMDAAARVVRTAFDCALPSLAAAAHKVSDQARKGSACLMLAMGSPTSPRACNISANARPTKATLVETIMQNRIGLA
jgi:hypothetical protein